MPAFDQIPRPVKTYHQDTYNRISKEHGFDGRGKTMLITGGAQNVGLSTCRAFAKAGVERIAIVSRSTTTQNEAKAEIESLYPATKVILFQASITDSAALSSIFEDLGTIDILILNATMAHRRALASDITQEEIELSFATNTTAAFALTKLFLNAPTPPSGSKTILNLSTVALQMLQPWRVGYASSKAASAQIMQQFAAEVQSKEFGQDVKIISFHPGIFATPLVTARFGSGKGGDVKWDDFNLPADFAVWLAGPQSNFLHGRHVWAHWDVDELIEMKEKLESRPDLLTVGLITS
ncbi:hypothetical protein PRZ48_013862 [Zasmidium cellare]|uniref:Ketoreductase domain-containing protein n=1 Tax=Zasmidium cellare TaxID=395010 RepID=A0ABR0E2A3_ZASCE|nr:hypothetical protein PRZ48_013862 [Zasmidium cellare]